jgi:hypothetical protein
MGSNWGKPAPPSRRLRLLVFTAVALAAAIVVIAVVALLYTALLGPATTG